MAVFGAEELVIGKIYLENLTLTMCHIKEKY